MQEILIDYIKGEQAEGKSRDAIEQQLIKSGYEAHRIETAFAMIDREAADPNSVSLSTDAQAAQLMEQRHERSLLNTIFIAPVNREWYLISSAALLIIALCMLYIVPLIAMGYSRNMFDIVRVVATPVAFLCGFMSFIIAIRRLHYMGMSGWWVFLLSVPIVGTGLWAYMLAKPDDK